MSQPGPHPRRSPRFWTLVGLGAGSVWLALVGFACADDPSFGRCVRTQLLVTLNLAVDLALVAASAWMGALAARQTSLGWLGWIVGIAFFAAVEGALLLLGLRVPPFE